MFLFSKDFEWFEGSNGNFFFVGVGNLFLIDVVKLRVLVRIECLIFCEIWGIIWGIGFFFKVKFNFFLKLLLMLFKELWEDDDFRLFNLLGISREKFIFMLLLLFLLWNDGNIFFCIFWEFLFFCFFNLLG